MLPKTKYGPSRRRERPGGVLITALILSDLGRPKLLPISLCRPKVLRTAMPEAPVDQDGDSLPCEGDVDRSLQCGHGLEVHPVPETAPMQLLTHLYLGCGVSPSDSGHTRTDDRVDTSRHQALHPNSWTPAADSAVHTSIKRRRDPLGRSPRRGRQPRPTSRRSYGRSEELDGSVTPTPARPTAPKSSLRALNRSGSGGGGLPRPRPQPTTFTSFHLVCSALPGPMVDGMEAPRARHHGPAA